MTLVSMATLVAGLRSGKLGSFPTDTVPALAVRPDRGELVFAAKGRPPEKPLILMGATATDLWPFVAGELVAWQRWQSMAEGYWPGALTLVLPASDRVPAAVNGCDRTTIGLRVPDCAIARAILSQTGPLATTSANRSGQPPLQTLAAIDVEFPDISILSPAELDGTTNQPETSPSGQPSTVIKWTGNTWVVLRQGKVKLALENG